MTATTASSGRENFASSSVKSGNAQRLVDIVALHENFWGRIGQHVTGDNRRAMNAWFHDAWNPWITAFYEAWEQTGGKLDEATVNAYARSLTALRALARSPRWSIPVPTLPTVVGDGGAALVAGHGHGGGGGHPAGHRPAPARRPMHGFHGRGGFYRHGHRSPGRWWWGPAGYVWIVSDVNTLAEDVDPNIDDTSPAEPVPEDRTRDVVNADQEGDPAPDVLDEALDDASVSSAPDPSGAAAAVSSGAARPDPLVAEMNRVTNIRFWESTGYKWGEDLNRNDPNDRAMIPVWLAVRYQVAREFAQRDRDRYATSASSRERARISSSISPQIPAFQRLPEKVERNVISSGYRRDLYLAEGYSPAGYQIVGVAATPPTALDDRLVSIAPVIAPGVRGTTVNLSLEGANLVVQLCIDGKCYTGAADLGGVIDDRIRALHPQLHAEPMALMGALAEGDPQGRVVSALVGALIEQHPVALCAGWWHSLTHSIESAASGAAHTLKKFKGPIAIAASTAAGAAALAIPGAGPFVAPMAASLAGSLVNAAAGSGSAKQVVEQAKALAKTNPQAAAALGTAEKAVAQATAGYHLAQTVANAAAGNPDARAQIAELANAAKQGDRAAQATMQFANDVTQQAGDNASVTSSGASPNDLRRIAKQAATGSIANIVGFCQPRGNPAVVKAFGTTDEADDWFGSWMQMPEAVEYIAYFDKNDITFPGPLNESFGRKPSGGAGAVSSGHWLLPLALGAGGGIAGLRFGPNVYHWLRDKLTPRPKAA